MKSASGVCSVWFSQTSSFGLKNCHCGQNMPSLGTGDDPLPSQLFTWTSPPQTPPLPRQQTGWDLEFHHKTTHQSWGLQVLMHTQAHQLSRLHPRKQKHTPTQGLQPNKQTCLPLSTHGKQVTQPKKDKENKLALPHVAATDKA